MSNNFEWIGDGRQLSPAVCIEPEESFGPAQPGSPEEEPRLSRRNFLKGAVAFAGGTAAGGILMNACMKPDESALAIPESLRTLPLAEPQTPHRGELDFIDTAYLDSLITGLQHENGTNRQRLRAVQNSLRVIRSENGVATAFQIDDSGIYLTARHTFLDNGLEGYPIDTDIFIENPYTGTSDQVKGCIAHNAADLGVLYAPTGKPPKPTSNMQLSFKDTTDKQSLWLVGLIPRLDSRLTDQYIAHGKVDGSHDFPAYDEKPDTMHVEPAASVAVDGMTMYGGTSGSPIVTRHGIITGIESGGYLRDLAKGNVTSNYKGARITPIAYAKSLADNALYLYQNGWHISAGSQVQ